MWVMGRKDNRKSEIIKTVPCNYGGFVRRRNPARRAAASDSGKCIWTGVYAGSTYDRSIKTASGKGGICFFDRDYAGYVHSGSSRSD